VKRFGGRETLLGRKTPASLYRPARWFVALVAVLVAARLSAPAPAEAVIEQIYTLPISASHVLSHRKKHISAKFFSRRICQKLDTFLLGGGGG
jgi:hypothetical protein